MSFKNAKNDLHVYLTCSIFSFVTQLLVKCTFLFHSTPQQNL